MQEEEHAVAEVQRVLQVGRGGLPRDVQPERPLEQEEKNAFDAQPAEVARLVELRRPDGLEVLLRDARREREGEQQRGAHLDAELGARGLIVRQHELRHVRVGLEDGQVAIQVLRGHQPLPDRRPLVLGVPRALGRLVDGRECGQAHRREELAERAEVLVHALLDALLPTLAEAVSEEQRAQQGLGLWEAPGGLDLPQNRLHREGEEDAPRALHAFQALVAVFAGLLGDAAGELQPELLDFVDDAGLRQLLAREQCGEREPVFASEDGGREGLVERLSGGTFAAQPQHFLEVDIGVVRAVVGVRVLVVHALDLLRALLAEGFDIALKVAQCLAELLRCLVSYLRKRVDRFVALLPSLGWLSEEVLRELEAAEERIRNAGALGIEVGNVLLELF